VYNGLVFVEASEALSGYDGLILNEKTGKAAGGFNAARTPAFANKLGFFVNDSTLAAQSIPNMKPVWSVKVDTTSGRGYATPPLVVGNIVYVETARGVLAGYGAANGKQKATVTLPNNIYYINVPQSLAYGDGELLVPNGPYLVAFTGS
jgi:outer membrane protein assembly factor BamB